MKSNLFSRVFAMVIPLVVWLYLSVSAQRADFAAARLESPAGYCPASASILASRAGGPNWNGWGVDPHNSRFQPAAEAGLSFNQVPGLRLRCTFGFDGPTSDFSQPPRFGGGLSTRSQRRAASRCNI